jgi:hypothetical protein
MWRLLANYSCLFPGKRIEAIQNRETELITYRVTFTYRSRNVPAYSDVYNEQFQTVAFLWSYFIKQSTKGPVLRPFVLRLFALSPSANINHLIYFLSFVVWKLFGWFISNYVFLYGKIILDLHLFYLLPLF